MQQADQDQATSLTINVRDGPPFVVSAWNQVIRAVDLVFRVRYTPVASSPWSIARGIMDTDRNLLFGVLALQADLINAQQFIDACRTFRTASRRRKRCGRQASDWRSANSHWQETWAADSPPAGSATD